MQVVIVEPEKKPVMQNIDDTLTSMQQIVGGTIQAVYPFEEPVALICNDEGKLLNLPLNRALRDSNGAIYDIVAGTFFLCAAPVDSDRFESLTDEQARALCDAGAVHQGQRCYCRPAVPVRRPVRAYPNETQKKSPIRVAFRILERSICGEDPNGTFC